MNATKRQYGKTGGIGLHGYQAFAPGETDPATARWASPRQSCGAALRGCGGTHLDRLPHASWSTLCPSSTAGFTEMPLQHVAKRPTNLRGMVFR
ncbi:MAG: hypothetical protein ACLT98_06285 [Eggerthellaceae bacterium]